MKYFTTFSGEKMLLMLLRWFHKKFGPPENWKLTAIILTGITIAQEGRIKLARLFAKLGYSEEVPYPDITTKSKAEAFVGLDMDKMKQEKERFINEIVPQWLKTAEQRELSYVVETMN